MIAENQTKANIGVGIAIVLNIAGFVMSRQADLTVRLAGAGISVLALPFWIWGCWTYAIGKGRHGAWCLMGLLGLIGLIVLVCLTDYYPRGKFARERPWEDEDRPRPRRPRPEDADDRAYDDRPAPPRPQQAGEERLQGERL